MNSQSQLPGFLSVDHIAMAVKPGEIVAQLELYTSLGFEEIRREDILGSDLVREVLLQSPDGNIRIQLLEPLDPSSPVARQIENNGGRGGVAHLAFGVSDIQQAFQYMKANGFQILDPMPRPGSCGSQIFFVHPKTTDKTSLGFLLEVVQPSGENLS